jgi:ABC-2 type transport system permease protein
MFYPQTFLLGMAGNASGTAVLFASVWALFLRFHQVRGWRFGEVALFYALINIAFSLVDCATRGFDFFGPQFVKTGDFDRVLLRPRPPALQVLGYEVRLSMLGRLIQALFALGVALWLLRPNWGVSELLLLTWTICGAMSLFTGILILQATLAFWTVDNLEIVNVVTYGGVEAGQYPLNIYAAWFRRFLLFLVPIGCVSYLPVAALLGRVDVTGVSPAVAEMAPGAGFAFLALALQAWRVGIGRYTSTGS